MFSDAEKDHSEVKEHSDWEVKEHSECDMVEIKEDLNILDGK